MIYGMPYMGSKNKIAEWLIDNLPSADVWIEPFCGGCAMTHAAILSGKYKRFIINDITDSAMMFIDAINGKFKEEERWISREDFEKLKDIEPYIRICWSFGNNQREYLYSQEIEPWKRALHHAYVWKDLSLFKEMGITTTGTSDDIRKNEERYKQQYIRWWLAQQPYTVEELDKMIGRCKNEVKQTEEQLREYLLKALRHSGLTQREVGVRLGTNMERHYFGCSQWSFPTQSAYEKMQEFMPLLDKDYNEIVGLYKLHQSLQSLDRLDRLQSLDSLQRLHRLQSLDSLQRLHRLQSLDSLQRLQRLQSESIIATQGDYREMMLPQGESYVIYCDPPYKDTQGYNSIFNHDEFYAWASMQDNCYISEYSMPDDFECIAMRKKGVSFVGGEIKKANERLYVNKRKGYRSAAMPLFGSI